MQSRVVQARPAIVTTTLAVVIGGAYLWTQALTGDWYYVRFALLPLLQDQFTVDGYTLFAAAHLADLVNLTLMLVPGVFVVAFVTEQRRQVYTAEQTYVLLLLFSSLFTAFLLDPKLGMPRDWDLFAFLGPPLLLYVWFAVLAPRLKDRVVRFGITAAIVVQATVLGGRVLVSASPAPAIDQAKAFYTYAPQRSRTGWNALSQFYLDHGDSVAYRRNEQMRSVRYPEESIARTAQRLVEQGDVSQGEAASLEAIRLNPRTFEAWVNYGRCLRIEGRLDRSLDAIQIANGLNPYGEIAVVELGMARLRIGDLGGAENAWLRALAIDSSHFITFGALANLSGSKGDTAAQIQYLHSGLARADAESWAAVVLAELFANQGKTMELDSLLSYVTERGFDSASIAEVARFARRIADPDG